jgi:hypothetical protein
MGERVAYYILPKERGRTADWQRARPIADYDPARTPYCPQYYLDKLDDWTERFGIFAGPADSRQGELSM